jgi:flagellar protein FlgJ
MIDPVRTAAVTDERDAALRRACARLEGVFMQEMLKALRATVPEGMSGGGAAEDMFTGMLDQHVADNAAARLERGLGAALYRQLRARFEESI